MAKQEINGLPIINAVEPITLTITDADINKADRKEPLDCVVARACRRSMRVKEVRVYLSRIYVRTNNGNWLRFMTPPSMRSEIIAFDRGGMFEPGEFRLAPPPPAKRTSKQQGSKTNQKGLGRFGVKDKAPRHVLTDVRGGPFA